MGAFGCVNFSRLSAEPLPTFTEWFKEQKLLWNQRVMGLLQVPLYQ
jgi:hypothetical protein